MYVQTQDDVIYIYIFWVDSNLVPRPHLKYMIRGGGGGGGQEKQYETPSSNTIELVERITNLLLKLKSDFRKKKVTKRGAEGYPLLKLNLTNACF